MLRCLKISGMNLVNKKKYVAELSLLSMTILWGGTFAIIKQGLDYSSPVLFVALRFSLAAILFILLVITKKGLFTRKNIMAGLFLGTLMFLAYGTQTAGLRFTEASRSAFLTGTVVVMIPLAQYIILKKKPAKGALIGTFFVLAGVLFLSSGGDNIAEFLSTIGADFNIGDFLTLLCAVFFTIHVIYLDVYSNKHDYRILVFFQILVSGIVASIFVAVFDLINFESARFEFSRDLGFALFYTSVLATILAITLQTRYQKDITPTKAGIIYSFEPVFAAIFAVFLLNEKITNFGYIGSALIFTGLIISETFDAFANGRKKTEKS